KECRATLKLKAGLKEIIFATTAPNDTRATDAAVEVERILRSEGHDLAVVVYGWGALQDKIAVHDIAYAGFCPSIVATSALQSPASTPSATDLASQVATQVVTELRRAGVTLPPLDADALVSSQEDPALHARIDGFRDLFSKNQQPQLA